MERPLTVGQLAHTTGVPAKTIRYYEQRCGCLAVWRFWLIPSTMSAMRRRLFPHPQRIMDLGVVALTSLIGFVDNEAVALVRIKVGKEIGSAALVAGHASGIQTRTRQAQRGETHHAWQASLG